MEMDWALNDALNEEVIDLPAIHTMFGKTDGAFCDKTCICYITILRGLVNKDVMQDLYTGAVDYLMANEDGFYCYEDFSLLRSTAELLEA